MTLDELKVAAQQALDELMQEQLLPFKLTAREVVADGAAEYTVRFYDSRIRSVTVTLVAEQSFKDLIRAATLARVRKMSGPLHKPKG